MSLMECPYCIDELGKKVKLAPHLYRGHCKSKLHIRSEAIFLWRGIPPCEPNECVFCEKQFGSANLLRQHCDKDKDHQKLVDAFQRSVQSTAPPRAQSPAPIRTPIANTFHEPTDTEHVGRPEGVQDLGTAMMHQLPYPVIARIPNTGNTCFAAVGFQCLRTIVIERAINVEDTYESPLQELHRLLRSETPKMDILLQMGNFQFTESGERAAGDMGDPFEFLTGLIERLQRVTTPTGAFRPELKNLFMTQIPLTSTVTCGLCLHNSLKREDQHSIHLSVPETPTTLETLVRTFLATEILSAANHMECNSCHRHGVNQRTFSVSEWPDYLFLQFKRLVWDAQQGRYKFLKTPVLCPPNLTVDGMSYTLKFKVIHNGSNHYVCEGKVMGKTYFFNDSTVVERPFSEAQTTQYIIVGVVYSLSCLPDVAPPIVPPPQPPPAHVCSECSIVFRSAQGLSRHRTSTAHKTASKEHVANVANKRRQTSLKEFFHQRTEGPTTQREEINRNRPKESRVPLSPDCSQGIEHNAAQAVKMFYDESLPREEYVEEIDQDTAQNTLESFRKEMRNSKELFICSTCGIHSFEEEVELHIRDHLEILKVKQHRPGLRTATFDGFNVHLNPLGLRQDVFSACQNCARSLRGSTVPPRSYAALDFGLPPESLPNLSVCEKVFLSRVVVHHTVIKINVKAGAYLPSAAHGVQFRGHVISFKAEELAMHKVVNFMDPTEAAGYLTVVVIGRRIGDPERRLAFERLSNVFDVRADVIRRWLSFLCGANEQFQPTLAGTNIEALSAEFRQRMFDKTLSPDTAVSLEGILAEEIATSDVTNLDKAAELSHVLITDHAGSPGDAVQRVARALKKKISQTSSPMNEYDDLRAILLGGFPWLFVSWPTDLGRSLSNSQIKTLFSRTDVVAQDPAALFFFYDLKVRREVCRKTAVAVKARKGYLEKLQRLLGAKDFDQTLDRAIKAPQGREAKVLEAQLLSYVQTCSRDIPFSPAKRRACVGPLYAIYRRFGLPSFWITFSPCQNDNVLALRIIQNGANMATFRLPGLRERSVEIQRHPSLTAVLFDRLVRTVCDVFFGIKDVSEVDKTRPRESKGAFGRSRAFFAVDECQKRGALHLHAVLWTHLSPHKVSEVLHDEEKNKAIGKILEGILCDFIDEEARAMLLRPQTEQYRGSTHEIPETYASDEFVDHVRNIIVETNCHLTHRATCFKQQRGSDSTKMCRFGMKSLIFGEAARFVTVFYNSGVLSHSNEVEAVPKVPNESFYPCPAHDDRPLLFLMRSEQDPTQSVKKGSIVVTFNFLFTACLRCNTCTKYMASEASARSILFYLVKYVTKDTHPLAGVLPLLKMARAEATANPSTKKDPGPNRHEHLVLLKLLNKIHRKMEVSSEMAAAVLMEIQSEYSSDAFSFLSVDRATKDICSRLEGGDSSEDEDSDCSDVDVARLETIVEQGSDRPILELVAERHVHYHFRGETLRFMDLYVYDAVVNVIKRSDVKEGGSGGRAPNKVCEFDERHPNKATHVQRLKSKHTLPVIIGKVPPLPPYEQYEKEYQTGNFTGQLRSRLKKHARFMVTLFSPWREDGIPEHEMSYSGYLELMRDVKKNNPAKYFVMCNFASPLKGSSNNQVMVNEYRRSCADSLEEAKLTTSLAEEFGFNKEMLEQELDRQVAVDSFGNDEGLDAANNFAESLCAEYALLTDGNTVSLGESTVGLVERNLGLGESAVGLAETSVPLPYATLGKDPVKHWKRLYVNLANDEKELRLQGKGSDNVAALANVSDVNFDHGRADVDVDDPIEFHGTDFISSEGKVCHLNHEQMEAVKCVERMINGQQQDPTRNTLFVLGGAGTGKSGVVRYLSQRLESKVMVTAPTGIAATVVNCTTIHAALGFTIEATNARNLKNLEEDEILQFLKVWKTVRVLIIDEISMVSKEFLECIDVRLKQILSSTRFMGGLVLVAVGDFHQIKPAGGTPLYKLTSSGATLHQNVFDMAYVLELHQQMRAPDDAVHCRILALLRTDPKAGLKMLIEHLKELSVSDLRFSRSPIIVCSNIERFHLNVAAAKRFSRERNVPLYAWTSSRTATNVNTDPAAFSFFIEGAPAFVNENLAPFTEKLANGTPVKMRALVAESLVIDRVEDGITYLSQAPKFVLVEHLGHIYPVSTRQYQKGSTQGSFQVELAFARTFHKVQGVTIHEGVVLDLKRRPASAKGRLYRLSLEGLYVALSRVTKLEDLRVLPWGPEGFAHLMRLAKKNTFPALHSAILLTDVTYTW